MAFNTKVDVADTELEENEAVVAEAEDVTLEDEALVEAESDVDEDDEEADESEDSLTYSNGAIDPALHRHYGRTMHLLGSTRRRLCRSGLNCPCLAFCFVLVGHYGNPSLTIWKHCAH